MINDRAMNKSGRPLLLEAGSETALGRRPERWQALESLARTYKITGKQIV